MHVHDHDECVPVRDGGAPHGLANPLLALRHFWFRRLAPSGLPILSPLLTMADAPVDPQQRRRPREERPIGRQTRQRLDDHETRLDGIEAQLRAHSTRLSYLEAPYKVVLRGWPCVADFFREIRTSESRVVKTAFIASFFTDLCEHCGPEAGALIDEAENLFAERMGYALIGVYPTGGSRDDAPDGVMRLQPGWLGDRISFLLSSAARCLDDSRQMFQDRVKRDKGKGKGKGKGQAEEGGRKGKGKDKGKGRGAPKRAVAP